MRLRIEHTTRYEFSKPVAHGLQRLRLTPKCTQGQKVLEWTMQLSGAAQQVEYDDHNHNRTILLSVTPGSTFVEVRCAGLVATADSSGVMGHHSGHMPLWTFLGQSALTRPGPKVRAIMARLDQPRDEPLTMLHRLSALVLDSVAYVTGETSVHTSGEEAALIGAGVCQDHAHIFIGAARALGIPARYVSGYLMMNDRIEQEAGHAWAEAHVDGLGSICTSVNHVVCHGIPSGLKLKDGDIVNIDVTVIVDGWHGDTSRMYFVGKPPIKAQRLTQVTYEAMMLGIEQVKPGARVSDIGRAIQTYAEKHGFSVVRDYCGHGIGKVFHTAPSILHYYEEGHSPVLQEGMFFTVEPMINVGDYQTILNRHDGWTVTTRDKSLSAQFEHTIAVTSTGYEIFTSSPKGVNHPDYSRT